MACSFHIACPTIKKLKKKQKKFAYIKNMLYLCTEFKINIKTIKHNHD